MNHPDRGYGAVVGSRGCPATDSRADIAQQHQGPSGATGRPKGPPESLFHWTLLLLSAGVILAALVLEVQEQQQVTIPLLGIPLPQLCSFRTILGIDCPGCGMTRCFISLAHGDLPSAVGYNLVGVFLFGLVVFQLPYRILQLWRLRSGQPELRLQQPAFSFLVLLSLLLIGQWFTKLLLRFI